MTLDDMPAPPPSRRPRWLMPSLRVRITLLTVLVFVVIQGALSVGLYLYVGGQREAALQAKIQERTLSLAHALSSTSALPSNESFASLVEAEPRSILVEDLLASLYTSKGKLLATNCKPEVNFTMAGGGDAALADGPVHRRFEVRALQTEESQHRSGRTVAVRLADPTGRELVLIVATSDEFVGQLTRELRDNIVLAVPIGVAAALVSGWFIAGIAVRPLKRLQQIAQLLSPSSLGARIDFGSTATEVQRLQERLNEARRRLDAGYRAQEQFAGNVAHELKTPLAIIVAQADLIRSDRNLPKRVKDFLDVTRDEALRLARLCESFLLLTRVRHGKPVHATSRPYLVNEWIMDCVQDSHGVAARFDVNITPTLLDDNAMDAQVSGDRELLCTMLDNLIRNACRFSPAGQTVEVSAVVDGARVRAIVRDHGPGVPPNMLERIFERFVQADNDEPAGRRGSGIGLQIAQGIATLHGGTIGVENRPDGGCAFTVTLPLTPTEAPMSDTTAAAGGTSNPRE